MIKKSELKRKVFLKGTENSFLSPYRIAQKERSLFFPYNMNNMKNKSQSFFCPVASFSLAVHPFASCKQKSKNLSFLLKPYTLDCEAQKRSTKVSYGHTCAFSSLEERNSAWLKKATAFKEKAGTCALDSVDVKQRSIAFGNTPKVCSRLCLASIKPSRDKQAKVAFGSCALRTECRAFGYTPTVCSVRRKTKALSLQRSESVTIKEKATVKRTLQKEEYFLETFKRSNQDTCLTHKPNVIEGNWVQSGDLLTDCASSVGGELSLGQNLFIAYMPWEGYNFEDAILISERLVMDDLYTSIHIERYELETQQTKMGAEEITRNLPDVSGRDISQLDSFGIVKLGSWVEEGDILVGKITPINKKKISPYQKLLYTILEKQVRPIKDSSLRAPKGIKAKVIDIKYFLKSSNFVTLKSLIKNNEVKKTSNTVKNLSASNESIARKSLTASEGKAGIPPLLNLTSTMPLLNTESVKLGKVKLGSVRNKSLAFFNQAELLNSAETSKQKAKVPFASGNIKALNGTKTNKVLIKFKAKGIFSSIKKNKKNLSSAFQSPKGCFLRKTLVKVASKRKKKERGIKKSFLKKINFLFLKTLPFNMLSKKHFIPLQKYPLLSKAQNRSAIAFALTKDMLSRVRNTKIAYGAKTKAKVKSSFNIRFNLFRSWFYKTLLQNKKFNKFNQESLNFDLLESLFFRKRDSLHYVQGKGTRVGIEVIKTMKKKTAFKILKKETTIKNIETIHIYLAEKRKVQVGDKMAGRHGNKGIISNILPIQDMPFLPDGTPIDMVLNPLGVPSRMNVGQIYECLLGLAGKYLGENYKVFSFDEIYGPEASRSFVFNKLYEARTKTGFKWLFDPNSPGKIRLFDGRTGECFDQKVTVGLAYMLRLVHMVDDKIHCLTPDHDVLTTDGWVPINKVTTEHKVATLKPSTGELVYQNPRSVLNYPRYNGDLYHVKNANIDLLVTLNHRMYVKKGGINGSSFSNYELIPASDIIGKHYRYLKKANWEKPDYQFILPSIISNSILIPEKKVDMDAWLTFFGLWIAEGWAVNNKIKSQSNELSSDLEGIVGYFNNEFDKSSVNLPLLGNTLTVRSQVKTSSLLQTPPGCKRVYLTQICQCKTRVIEILYPAIKKLGYHCSIVKDKLSVNDKQLWSYLRPLSVGAPNKSLPSWVWELSQTQAQKLLHALCLGDGTWRNTSVSYYTSSVKLADDVMRLALHAGWSANNNLHIPKGQESAIDGRKIISQYDVWRVSIIKSKNNPAVNHGHHMEQNSQIEEIIPSYQGSVHCLSVPNEVFYVRRNGIPVWTGNSRSTGPYSLVTQQPLRGRSKQGGQRLGEMEVWALEGYGAAFTLLEMLTIKSDDMTGRMALWSNLILNKDISIGTPESFKVLISELQALCLDIGLFRNLPTLASPKAQLVPADPQGGNLREIQSLMNLP